MDAISVLEEYNNILSDQTALAILIILAALTVVARQQEFKARTRMILLSFMLLMAWLRTSPVIYEKTQSITTVYAVGVLMIVTVYTLHRYTSTASIKALDREWKGWKETEKEKKEGRKKDAIGKQESA